MWNRLRRCIKDMPDTLEVLLRGGGCLHATERGAESKYFVPTLPFSFIIDN